MSNFGLRDAQGLISWGLSSENLREFLPPGFPKIVTLCGSTRFREAYEKAQKDLTLQGCLVFTVGLFGHAEALDMDGPIKKMLDELHLKKIDLSDSIFVINAPRKWCEDCQKWQESIQDTPNCQFSHQRVLRPYIGESTRREIEYAKATGKLVQYLNPVQE